MADQNADLWPIPKFHFTVDFEGDLMSCQEVTGLKLSTEQIEYRFGDDPTFIKKKLPGLKKFENITLKKEYLQMISEYMNGTMKYKLILLKGKK